MDPVEIIKLARWTWTPLSLIALALILYYLMSLIYFFVKPERRVAHSRLYLRIFNKFWIIILVLVVLGTAAYALPYFFSDKVIRGVVVVHETGATIGDALVSVDGYPQLNYKTSEDGNFRLTIPARERQEEYILHAQISREGQNLVAESKIRDGELDKRSVRIEFPEPHTTKPTVRPPNAAQTAEIEYTPWLPWPTNRGCSKHPANRRTYRQVACYQCRISALTGVPLKQMRISLVLSHPYRNQVDILCSLPENITPVARKLEMTQIRGTTDEPDDRWVNEWQVYELVQPHAARLLICLGTRAKSIQLSSDMIRIDFSPPQGAQVEFRRVTE